MAINLDIIQDRPGYPGRNLFVAISEQRADHDAAGTRLAASLGIIVMVLLLAVAAWPAAARRSIEALGLPVSVEDRDGRVGLMTLPPAPADPRAPPAVLLVHDALGPELRSLAHVEQLAAAGLLVLEIGPEPEEPLTETVRLGVAALRVHPRVDAARLGLLGFGGGARAAMLATEHPAAVAAQALLYPGCAGQLRDLPPGTAAPRGRLLLMHGAEDPADGEADCTALAHSLAGGLPIRCDAFRGATDGRDFPLAEPLAPWLYPVPDGAGRMRIQPWPALTALGASEASSVLASVLRQGGR
jgi:dienelactone hydrolase